MEYPFLNHLLFQAAPEDAATDETPAEDPSTDETTDAPAEDAPAEDSATDETADTSTDMPVDPEDLPVGSDVPAEAPAEGGPDLNAIVGETGQADVDALKQEIDSLKKKIKELEGNFDLETEVTQIKKRLDNLNVPDNADINDNLFESGSIELKQIKRSMRRMFAKKADLNGQQQEKIILEIKTNPQLSYQQLAKKLSSMIDANEQDIFDYLSNLGHEYKHRHRRYL